MANSKIGIHSIQPNKVLSFILQAKLRGVTFPVVKSVDDTGTCTKVKEINRNIITITRIVTAGDALQDVQLWDQTRRVAFAKQQIQIIFDRCKDQFDVDHPEIRVNTDYWEIVNEADPKGFYDYLGLALIELVKEANNRGIKLALPAFNAGTPEWDDMNRLVNTGLFGLMKSTGHILSIHEGVFGSDQPVNLYYGDQIPGSPVVAGAGALCFRHNYLYSLLKARNEVVKLVVAEFYAGGGYTLDPALVVERMKWYDTLAQKEDYLLAFLPFTIDPNSTWKNQDYTYAYDAIINYMATLVGTVTPPPPPVNKIFGLHGRADGRLIDTDYSSLSTGKIEALKLLTTASPDDVDKARAINPNMFFLVRLYADFRNRTLSPNQFYDSIKSDLANFYNKGVRYFEIHNEPNIYFEGYSTSWTDGVSFTNWFNAVYQLCKGNFPQAQFGFPGISPGAEVPNVRADANRFISQLGTINADWIGLHHYWATEIELFQGQVAVNDYKTRFNKPIFITEFSNNTHLDKSLKAQQYIKFYRTLKGVQSAFCFVSSASNGFTDETWDGSQIANIVGSRETIMVGKTVEILDGTFLNMRSGPGTTNPVLTTLCPNSRFIVQEESGNWVRVTINGWISKTYIKLV